MIIDMHTHNHNYELCGDGLRFSSEDFVHELDHHGIDMAAVSPAFYLETDFVFGNELVLEFGAEYPDRIIPFVCAHPLFPDESVKIIEKGVGKGAKGVKLHCELSYFPYTDPRHLRIVEAAGHFGLPVTIHSAGCLEQAAKLVGMFPDTTFLLGHIGGSDYRALLEKVRMNDNAVADLCGNVYLNDYVEDVVGALGDERVVYSSDFTLMDPVIMLEMVRRARIPDVSKEKILGGNARRILGI